jgi:hypothetical protein
MTNPTPAPDSSGADLARMMLAAARRAAKTAPTQHRPASGRPQRRRGRNDPVGLGAAIAGLMDERGWEPVEQGGSLLDRWPSIAGPLAEKAPAIRYEHDHKILHLQPISAAYAMELNLKRAQIIQKIKDDTEIQINDIAIIPPGAAHSRAHLTPAPRQIPGTAVPAQLPNPRPDFSERSTCCPANPPAPHRLPTPTRTPGTAQRLAAGS